ncbi:glycosyltransferase family 1 protein [Bradyrhizobium sp. BR 10289]|uniref:glycosyltransferase family 4 protein n=1 Tax=Bradyrhizobium sp. BR 10289 TaxID=2749993 RepID=UPI0032DE6BF3
MPSQFGGKPSGVARMAFCLIEALLKNPKFDYVLRSPWERRDLPMSLQASPLDVITIRRPPVMIADVIRQIFSMPIFCRQHDIDLLVNIDPFGAPTGARARVMIVHDLYFRVLPQQVSRREAFTTDIIYRLMLANHDRVVTVSDATKRDLLHHYPAGAARATTVHSAATLAPISLDVEGPEIEGRYVLAVGNATLNKNFKVLAEAMASLHQVLPDVALVHVGSDPSESIGNVLSARRSTLRLVRLTGIDDNRLARLYRHAECLCVPSLYEGFCLPVLEAQGLSCPVVCSDRSATPEVAGPGAMTFNPEDPEMLSKKLHALLTNTELRGQLVQHGLENQQSFSWTNAANQYEEIFRQAISKRAPESTAARPT